MSTITEQLKKRNLVFDGNAVWSPPSLTRKSEKLLAEYLLLNEGREKNWFALFLC